MVRSIIVGSVPFTIDDECALNIPVRSTQFAGSFTSSRVVLSNGPKNPNAFLFPRGVQFISVCLRDRCMYHSLAVAGSDNNKKKKKIFETCSLLRNPTFLHMSRRGHSVVAHGHQDERSRVPSGSLLSSSIMPTDMGLLPDPYTHFPRNISSSVVVRPHIYVPYRRPLPSLVTSVGGLV